MDNKKIFAKNLEMYMKKFDVDRYKIVEITGAKYTTVANWLQGANYPRVDKIQLLADYFGVKKSALTEEHIQPAALLRDIIDFEETINKPIQYKGIEFDDQDRISVLVYVATLFQTKYGLISSKIVKRSEKARNTQK